MTASPPSNVRSPRNTGRMDFRSGADWTKVPSALTSVRPSLASTPKGRVSSWPAAARGASTVTSVVVTEPGGISSMAGLNVNRTMFCGSSPRTTPGRAELRAGCPAPP